MSTKKIGVLCGYTFPQGMAPSNRIITYCTGLAANDIDCEIHTFWPSIIEEKKPMEGEINGIKYKYSHRRSKNANKLSKIFLHRPLCIIKVLRNIIKSNKKEPYDYLFLSFDSIILLSVFIPILKFFKIDLAFIGDEYPPEIRRLKRNVSFINILLYKLISKGIRIRILMTNKLEHFYNENVGYKPTHILPTIIDTKRFVGLKKIEEAKKYICYMGNLELAKDNVTNIIEAFYIISQKYVNIDLFLFGLPQKKDEIIMDQLISKLELSSRVFLKGRIDYALVPQILINSYILVASQPNTKRAEGGFPTKLGEYLMSGVPTVATNVGEIANYISDGINVFLVNPSNSVEFAEKMEYIINNYEEALQVARNAKDYISTNFNCEKICKQLKIFLDQHNLEMNPK